jgi:exosome complex protein LRP1
MTSETAKAKTRLSALASSFDDLEELLEPLFSQALPETVAALEPIQQAKLQTVLPYLVYDIIFIYLKTRGVDPKGHHVISELDRVKQYFEKIANAEKTQDSMLLCQFTHSAVR